MEQAEIRALQVACTASIREERIINTRTVAEQLNLAQVERVLGNAINFFKNTMMII